MRVCVCVCVYLDVCVRMCVCVWYAYIVPVCTLGSVAEQACRAIFNGALVLAGGVTSTGAQTSNGPDQGTRLGRASDLSAPQDRHTGTYSDDCRTSTDWDCKGAHVIAGLQQHAGAEH